jgi:hypothetical protein
MRVDMSSESGGRGFGRGGRSGEQHGGPNAGKGQQKLVDVIAPDGAREQITNEQWRTGDYKARGYTRPEDTAETGDATEGTDAGTIVSSEQPAASEPAADSSLSGGTETTTGGTSGAGGTGT